MGATNATSLLVLIDICVQKLPVGLVCDDACGYVANCFQRYPTESELAFGEKRGCFEKPSDDVAPTRGISCPDIIPTELQSGPTNRAAMENPSNLVHPDTSSSQRYVFGTRLIEITMFAELRGAFTKPHYNFCQPQS